MNTNPSNMKKQFYAFGLTAFLINTAAFAQLDCSGGRYATEIFPTYTKTEVTYGSAINYLGQNQSLEMDIYQPVGDVANGRPVIILAHGGSFVSLDKSQDSATVKMARHLAKCGYVVASIEYRINSPLNIVLAPNKKEFFLNVIYDALTDMKAAIRFFRKSHAVDGNPYKIDPNLIIAGGNAAGGIMGSHIAFLDKVGEIPAEIDTTGQNGLEGISGNPGYASTILGVLSWGGCVGDTNWMEPGDTYPMVTAHATNDATVPYGSDTARPSGIAIMYVHGSFSMRERGNNLGMYTGLHAFLGAPYSCYSNTATEAWNATKGLYYDTLQQHTTAQLHYILCQLGVGTSDVPVVDFTVYPNPTTEGIFLDLPSNLKNADISIVNITGQVMSRLHKDEITEGKIYLDTRNFAKGLYIVKLQGNEGAGTRSFVIE